MTKFDAHTLGDVRSTQEVRIRTGKHPDSAVVIWVVAVGDEVFVRSFRGARGRWYRDLAQGGPATLELAGKHVSVQAVPATGAATIDRVSREFLSKYTSSSYAQAMVKADILDTTLRLDPS